MLDGLDEAEQIRHCINTAINNDTGIPPQASMAVKLETDIDPDKSCLNCGQPRSYTGCSTCAHCGTSICE